MRLKLHFQVEKAALAYQFDVGNVGLSVFDVLGQFLRLAAEAFGRPVDVESGVFGAGCPFEIIVDIYGVDGEHVVAARTRPVIFLIGEGSDGLNAGGLLSFPLV